MSKKRTQREEPCFICGHYHDVSCLTYIALGSIVQGASPELSMSVRIPLLLFSARGRRKVRHLWALHGPRRGGFLRCYPPNVSRCVRALSGVMRWPKWVRVNVQTHTYIHASTHTHMHTHTHTHAHTHAHTRTHTCMHTHTNTDTHVHTHRHTHRDTHTHAFTYACTRAHTHTHTHTHTHAHTHKHTYTRRPIIAGFLYLGSYDSASRSELLKTMGITHILNVSVSALTHTHTQHTHTTHTQTHTHTLNPPAQPCLKTHLPTTHKHTLTHTHTQTVPTSAALFKDTFANHTQTHVDAYTHADCAHQPSPL